MNNNKANITIGANPIYLTPIKNFILDYARSIKIGENEQIIILNCLNEILPPLINNSQNDYLGETISISTSCENNSLQVELINKGVPFGINNEINQLLKKVTENFGTYQYSNEGRNGQKIKFEWPKELGQNHSIKNEITSTNDNPKKNEQFEIRFLDSDESHKLTKLFHSVYGYKYIQEFVYHPQILKDKIKKGNIISLVASNEEGELAGHIALVKQNTDPIVYEAALGVVNPKYNSNGIFSRIFSKIMQLVDETPMSYALYDFVTNHVYSQKFVSKFNSCEMSIQIGSQISETQAKLETLGLGTDFEEMDRYSILVSVKPMIEAPFGNEVILPNWIGELSEFILDPLGINWISASRFYPLPSSGHYSRVINDIQKNVFFDVYEPGEDVLFQIIEEWKHLLRLGHKYAAIDVPLDRPGIGQLYDFLIKRNFFISGFIPYKMSDRLGLRMQSLGPTRVAFDKIKVYSQTSKRLLELIKYDYERNCTL